MSEVAELIVDGALCQSCACVIDGDVPGYPRDCARCAEEKRKEKKRQ